MNQITTENWNFCYYTRGDLKACITMAMEPGQDEFEYMLTLLDPKNNEVHQKSFLKLEKAVLALNSEYKHWDFLDLKAKNKQNTNSSGCSSCQAH